MQRVVVISALAIVCSSASTQTGAGGFVYGKDHAYLLEAPKGWVMDSADPAKENVGAVFHPANAHWSSVILFSLGLTNFLFAFRDLPHLIHQYGIGRQALDFGCGTGRSSRFLRDLGLDVTGVDISEAMLDQARALDPAGDYRLVRSSAALDQFRPGSFGVILAAFTFDNIPTDAAKTDALRRLRSVLALNGALFLVVSSAAIYVNEWASFSTKDFPENRDARDGDRVHIVMLDVPDRRPVEDVLCTDANYRRLFEDASLELREMRSPLATEQETTPWLSETTTAPWTIYVLSHLTGR